MNILALDLGTNTGWALHVHGKHHTSGTVNFSLKKLDTLGMRWQWFRKFLTERGQSAGEIHAVYYEDVKNHIGVLAAHAYGGFLAHLEHWCCLNNIPLVPVGVGTIKKHWTGRGNAKKDDMIAEAIKRGFTPVDDNHADSLAILDYALKQESIATEPAF